MKEKVIEYLEAKGIKIDDNFMKYLEGKVELTDQDEYMHVVETFPPHHNESWYFNFIDRPNNVHFITRLSFEMDKKRALILVLLIIDGKTFNYFTVTPVEKMPENWEFDKKLKYYCIKPMKQWRIKYEDRKFNLDVTFNARFPVFNSAPEDPIAEIEKYGLEILDVAAQQHYVQAMIATGTLVLKKKGETRNIKCFSHRDHSWGARDWVNIDAWNWVGVQFEDKWLSFVRSDVLGKNPQFGVLSTKDETIKIEKVEVNTKTKEDGKTPVSSTFTLTDENGKTMKIVSNTIFSMHLPLPSEKGITEIFEQVAVFTWEGKEGDGISEYLISTRH
ncbi:MAG: hypothetical protein HWN66_01260 [Candidatus Helarchaeota archaeon]|nr:hypothetical protein [Candidatus Helarchaeota archaeon]